MPTATTNLTALDLGALDLGALDVATADTASWIGLGVLALLAVAAILLVTKFFAKVVVVAIIATLAIAIWTQRADLAACPRTCDCSVFGYQLEIGDASIDGACRDIAGAVS